MTAPCRLLLLAILCAAPASALAQWFGQPPAVPAAPAAPAVAPEDVPYTNNIVANPGFEKGFEKDSKSGWTFSGVNGVEAKFETAAPNKPVAPFEGKKSLRIFVKDAVKIPTKALKGPWDEFKRSANDGKGSAKGSLVQLVPVRPGATYALRFRWRASGLYSHNAPGPDRGLVHMNIRTVWCDKSGRGMWNDDSAKLCPSEQIITDSAEWATFSWPKLTGPQELPRPTRNRTLFTAPNNAAYLRIEISLECLRPKVKPEIWLDQFELAEQPPKPAAGAAK